MHPLYVASSTALGAMSSVLALLLPHSWLACCEVRKLCRVYAANASERMNLYLKAFSAHSNQTKMELISQAKPFAETGSKILHSIRILQPGMQWERPCNRYWKPDFSPEERLQRSGNADEGNRECSNFFSRLSAPETGGEFIEKILLPLELIFTMKESVLFFFSCIEMFLDDSTVRRKPKSTLDTHISPGEVQTQQEPAVFGIRKAFRSWITKHVDKERLVFASKCSLSLGLAVLFGLMFNKENGCWSGLSIAISFVTGRHAVFTIANTRAQGTAIGSVYGVLCCYLFQNYAELRFLALLPWIIFTGFLRHSRMYGQTGGTSSAIGALLILGRKNYGTPNEFAIIRLTEVLIGLSCFIVVELFMQPTRAATLAKSHLHLSLITLQDCIKHIGLYCGQKDQPSSTFHEFREKQENLKSLVCELERSTADAESEPDFWYLPFRRSCYQKLVGSLSNIVDVLYFITYNLKILSELPESCSVAQGELQENVNNAMGHFQETLSSSLRCLEMATLTESLAVSKEPDEKIIQDVEEGTLQNQNAFSDLIMEDGEAHKILRYTEDVEKEDSEGKKELRGRMVICSGALGFCISILSKEIKDLEIGIKELTQWEYHSRQ
ncbi:Fusaric acid resistance protein [Abeliophyllum distichum]|uniref:Fusaric acid resistance protein n=1 Tax=Abeliophyllum distichum TaxID=126358 RepID=A0ABD1QZC6_9LAMI